MVSVEKVLTASPALTRLIDRLEQAPANLPLDQLLSLMADCPLSASDLEPFIRFGRADYHDEPILVRPGFEVRCLAWRSGQHTAVHDHLGSCCGMRVIHGTLTNIDLRHTSPGHLMRQPKILLRAGDLLGRQDTDTHQVGNALGRGHDVVTLHVYTPPLSTRRASAFCPLPNVSISPHDGFLS